jgi:hypothetical protein
MMTCLDQTGIEINIDNVVGGSGVANENAAKVVTIQFTAMKASTLNANPRSKCLEASKVWFIPA